MKHLLTFIWITLFIMFVVLACTTPELHKPFILESENFKLVNMGQLPQDSQTVSLSKIGDIPQQKDIKIAHEPVKVTSSDADIKIIPTAFIDSKFADMTPKSVENDGNLNNEVSNQEPDNSDEVLEEVEKMLGNKTSQEHREDLKYREELIVWNEWRSNLQNTIMEYSDVDGVYGTIYFFFFTVDKNRHISSIKVRSTTRGDKENIDRIYRTIQELEGSEVLQFPKGSNRASVKFTGGFMIAFQTQYSSPSDYSDVERIFSP